MRFLIDPSGFSCIWLTQCDTQYQCGQHGWRGRYGYLAVQSSILLVTVETINLPEHSVSGGYSSPVHIDRLELVLVLLFR